jgi:hypothetical protein
MKALLIVISAVLFAGAAALAFLTLVAFAGHPSGLVVWMVSKWEALFNNDPAAPIEILAVLSLISFAKFGGGLAVALKLWIARRRH